MTDYTVWQPTDQSLRLAEAFKQRYAVEALLAHRDWRRSCRGRYEVGQTYSPHGFRGDVDVKNVPGGKVEIINALGEVDWHDDEGFPPYSHFIVLRNRQYVVKQRGVKVAIDQPFGSVIRLNILKQHALHLVRDRKRLEHGIWLATQLSSHDRLELDDILIAHERAL